MNAFSADTKFFSPDIYLGVAGPDSRGIMRNPEDGRRDKIVLVAPGNARTPPAWMYREVLIIQLDMEHYQSE